MAVWTNGKSLSDKLGDAGSNPATDTIQSSLRPKSCDTASYNEGVIQRHVAPSVCGLYFDRGTKRVYASS